MAQTKTIVHTLTCDICDMETIDDFGEVIAKDTRKWARKSGWGYHSGKDYCPSCEREYQKTKGGI